LKEKKKIILILKNLMYKTAPFHSPGPRAQRANRQQAEEPRPALCRPVAIHTRNDGSPRAGGGSQACDVKKIGPYIYQA